MLLVTVPLCPLYNPGNPRQAAARRGGNGAGQSAAGTAPAHRAAEVKVTMGLSSRFHRCGGPNLPSQPPTTFPGAFLTASVILNHKLKAFLQYLLFSIMMARAEAASWRFSAAGLGLSRGREEAQGSSANAYCPTPSQLPHPAPICRPNASTTTDKPAPSYLTCAPMFCL